MRRLVVIPAAGLVLAFAAGCGGKGAPLAGGVGSALAYVPTDATVVVLVTTDLEGDRAKALERMLLRAHRIPRSFRDQVAAVVGQNLDYDEDIEPLLGSDLVIAAASPEGLISAGDLLAVLDTGDGDKLRATIVKAGGQKTETFAGADLYSVADTDVAVDGDVLVVGPRDDLREAVARADGGDHLTAERLDEAMSDLPENAAARGYIDSRVLLEREEIAAHVPAMPWFAALRDFAFSLGTEGDRISFDLAAVTDAARLTNADLPLAPGDETPEVLQGHEDEIVGATANQSQTTVFLLRAARLAFPDSDFVGEVREVERELGIDFETEVLRQFDGPSASAVSGDGTTFAARSKVRDPERLQALLERLAPRLPGLIEGLQGLRSRGMALLFLLAPDAPGTRSLAEVRVTPPPPGDSLYHVTGLTGDGPSELYFGVIGDVFVVASDEERARKVADESAEPVGLVDGESVFRAPGAALEQQQGRIPFLPVPASYLQEVAGGIDATRARVRASLRIELAEAP